MVVWQYFKLSVISVGKNSYGHPSSQTLELLKEVGSNIKRTDEEGDIEVVSDGKGWMVKIATKTANKLTTGGLVDSVQY